jgi:hypothetical protein
MGGPRADEEFWAWGLPLARLFIGALVASLNKSRP